MSNKYYSHNCGELTKNDVGLVVHLSGWVHRKRNHGKLLFLDLRDSHGITQLVAEESANVFDLLSLVSNESVITVSGKVIKRDLEARNAALLTGDIEVIVNEATIESPADSLPFEVNSEKLCPEDLRLQYRFLDLRRSDMNAKIVLRSNVIARLRELMWENGFMEFSTPILTSSSPEGARDFLVPSRLHKGKFYALPQAPQQFKQLLMISGFEKYFQIAPCFRDEDARADRSPGEFYQLDIEMSFVTSEDIFTLTESVLYNIFKQFSNKKVTKPPFPRISYKDAIMLYGTDKPDLRNPLLIFDVTSIFADSGFSIFEKNIKNGMIVKAIPAPKTASFPRSFFDQKINFTRSLGGSGLAYVVFDDNGFAKGPIAKLLSTETLDSIKDLINLGAGDAVFFSCEKPDKVLEIASSIRIRLGNELNLLSNEFAFCWVVDFPFYQRNKDTGSIEFSHNPFSMPKGGMNSLIEMDPLEVVGEQYDIVCNAVELSSGAIRNHKLDVLYKAFEIVGYSAEMVDAEFGALTRALHYGAPPHGGIAPGIDRMIMLLTESENIREVVCFPQNQKAEDLLMGAPSAIKDAQLRDLGLMLKKRS